MGIPNGFWGDRIQEQGEGEPTTWLECDKLTCQRVFPIIGLYWTLVQLVKKTFLNKVNSGIYYSKNYALDFSKIIVLQIIIYLYYLKLSSYYFSLLYCKQVR
jgi:hypothetical protein